jgi:hypothetical protein
MSNYEKNTKIMNALTYKDYVGTVSFSSELVYFVIRLKILIFPSQSLLR